MNKESLTTTRNWTTLPSVVPTTMYGSDNAMEPQAGSVLDYWHTISRRKLLLTSFGAVGLLIGIGVTLPQSRVYRAITTLEIQNAKDDILTMKVLNPVPDSSPADPTTEIQTQIKLLQSKTLIERALNKVQPAGADLAPHPPHPSDVAGWRRFLPLPSADQSQDSLVEKAAKNLKVSADGQTRIVEVSFDANSPDLAARFANALTSEFMEQNLEARLQLNRRTSEWLGGQLEELRGKLPIGGRITSLRASKRLDLYG